MAKHLKRSFMCGGFKFVPLDATYNDAQIIDVWQFSEKILHSHYYFRAKITVAGNVTREKVWNEFIQQRDES